MNFPAGLGIASAAEAELKIAALRERIRRKREALQYAGTTTFDGAGSPPGRADRTQENGAAQPGTAGAVNPRSVVEEFGERI